MSKMSLCTTYARASFHYILTNTILYIGETDIDSQIQTAEVTFWSVGLHWLHERRWHISTWLLHSLIWTGQCQWVPAANHSNQESAIVRHLLTTRHQIDIHRAFRPTFHSHWSDILRYVEAVTIKRMNFPVCVQKQLFVNFKLPWLSVYSSPNWLFIFDIWKCEPTRVILICSSVLVKMNRNVARVYLTQIDIFSGLFKFISAIGCYTFLRIYIKNGYSCLLNSVGVKTNSFAFGNCVNANKNDWYSISSPCWRWRRFFYIQPQQTLTVESIHTQWQHADVIDATERYICYTNFRPFSQHLLASAEGTRILSKTDIGQNRMPHKKYSPLFLKYIQLDCIIP